ncbi:hypothetical protein KCU77_g923, partial [Aureobasidium melanogenum]
MAVISNLADAMALGDAEAVENCFFAQQAFWKDQLAFTWHLRTFITPKYITRALLETQHLRYLITQFELVGDADLVQVGPKLLFLTCSFAFETRFPAAKCRGKMWLLPYKPSEHQSGAGGLNWKIWIMSTRLDYLHGLYEHQDLLHAPCQPLSHLEIFETDVLIVGAGNAAAALAARLKALGVSKVMADRNAHVGDNWALRYDSLKFHVPTPYCELPYEEYHRKLREKILGRDDLAAHLKRYVKLLDLYVINSVEITKTVLGGDGRWRVEFKTPYGPRTTIAKHLVQATGIGSQVPYTPSIPERQAYDGAAIHSTQYKNPTLIKDQGVKSVYVVGSASTAFDVVEDCYNAGLQVTMVVRSPQYFGVDKADELFMMMPTIVDSQLGQKLFQQLASQEPDRYLALREAGFPVIDSRDPDAALMHNLIERGGGHYVDTGATKLLAEGKVSFRAGVEPKSYTNSGLHPRETVADIMKISLPVDATWGVDKEGEIRGMWKRHAQVDNYWFMGGFTQQHRWHSHTLAQQIKASLAGVLPPPYIGPMSNLTDTDER